MLRSARKPAIPWSGSRSRPSDSAVAREPVRDEDPAVGDLPGLEIGTHEDGAPAPTRPALDKIAGDPLGADRVEAAVQVGELGSSHRRVGNEGVDGATRRPRRPHALAERSVPRFTVVAHRIAKPLGRPPRRRGLPAEQLEPELGLQVVLVLQGRLDHSEVTLDGALQLRGVAEEDVVLEQHRPQAHVFGDFEKLVAAVGVLEVIERRAQLRVLVEPLTVDDDRETEVDGDEQPADRPPVGLDEVVESGHHAVAGSPLALGVVHCRVQTPALEQAREPGSHPVLRVRLAELVGDLLGRVVEVAPSIGPPDVVENENGEGDLRAARASRRAARARGTP